MMHGGFPQSVVTMIGIAAAIRYNTNPSSCARTGIAGRLILGAPIAPPVEGAQARTTTQGSATRP